MKAGERLGKYRLDRLLGTGGMAEAWQATMLGAEGFARTVVVKRILAQYARDPAFVRMFIAEALLSARLSHPNIVQVFELEKVGDEHLLSMELLDGYDLGRATRAMIQLHREIPIAFAVAVARDLCLALHHAYHAPGADGAPLHVIHRDVSPSNIHLGRNGVTKLLDFGIAKALGESVGELTRTGSLKGKISYMSPEQANGDALDHRSDLFAVGVVLHELLAQQRLFKGPNELKTLALVRDAAIVAPSSLRAEVPPALDAVVLRLLARDPAQRYATGREAAEALAPWAAGWSGEALGQLLAELFPNDPAATETTRTAAPSPTISAPTGGAPTTVDGPRASPRLRPIAWGVGGAMLASGLALALYAARPSAVAPLAPTSSAEASPAPTAPSPPTRIVSPAPSAPSPTSNAAAPSPARSRKAAARPATRKADKKKARFDPDTLFP